MHHIQKRPAISAKYYIADCMLFNRNISVLIGDIQISAGIVNIITINIDCSILMDLSKK